MVVVDRAVTEIEAYGPLEDGVPRRFEVDPDTFIGKGQILKFTTPRTASKSTGTGDIFAGIAAADKSATDSATSIAAWQNGIYEFTASNQITAGDLVQTAAAIGNYVMRLGTLSSHQITVGYALKDAADGERVQVRVNN